MKKQKSVFEIYAYEYDLITNAQQREPNHAKEVTALINKFHPESVLDAGCAAGLTSMLFAKQGVKSIGLDRSQPMLDQCLKKYDNSPLPLSFIHGNFESLPKKLTDNFDMVACIANSISGITTIAGLKNTFGSFYSVLKPGGVLVLQMLNYASMKEGTIFPIKATENNGIVYERFSERQKNKLYVYITRFDMNAKPRQYEVFRHQFDNFTPNQVVSKIKSSGFDKIRKYGNLLLTKRFTKSSRDLVITAVKPSDL